MQQQLSSFSRVGAGQRQAPRAASAAPSSRRRSCQVACYYRRSQATITRPQAPHQQDQQQAHNGNGYRPKGKGIKPYQTRNGKSVLPSTRSVKFNVRYKCEYGQEVYLVGNCSALGDWDVMQGVQLVWSPGHIWEGAVELPAGLHIQYKYVVRNRDGSVVRWQEGANVSLELPGGHSEALALAVEDSWNKSKQVKRVLASGTPVRFNIRCKLEFGQSLVVLGSCSALGAWNMDAAPRLSWQEGHIWEAGVELPAGEVVEYKYLVRNADGSVDRWQPGDNLVMEVPVAQGHNGRRRGVLVLDTWSKSAPAKRSRSRGAAPSWRSTPFSSVPAGGRAGGGASGVAVHTDSPRFGEADIDSASAAMAARTYYSMMQPAAGTGSTAGIRDPEPQQQSDPNLVQLWTDKPRFAQQAGGHQAHQDPWTQQQQQQGGGAAAPPLVPPPPPGAGAEELARWQALQSVMSALQHSSELDHWVDDPTDPRMLAADRRLAALTASLGSCSKAAAMA